MNEPAVTGRAKPGQASPPAKANKTAGAVSRRKHRPSGSLAHGRQPPQGQMSTNEQHSGTTRQYNGAT